MENLIFGVIVFSLGWFCHWFVFLAFQPNVDKKQSVDMRGCSAGGDIVGGDYYPSGGTIRCKYCGSAS